MAETEIKPAGATPVAVIDVGSNSIRMVVAEVFADGSIHVLERLQRAVHLGQDTFTAGRLSPRTINAAVAILGDFRKVLTTYGVGRVRAVATSAVREALNAEAFLDRAYVAAGLDVEIISTSEESRLEVAAVRQALASAPPIEHHEALVVEVGGGSALLTVLHEGQILRSESYRLGSIRLQESLSIREGSPQRLAGLIRQQIAGIMGSLTGSLPLKRIETFFAVGGDARFAARLIGQPTSSPLLHILSRRRFDQLVERFEAMAVPQLVRQHGLSQAEAETLVPALLVLQELVHKTSVREIIVSQTSMRDGLLLDLAGEVTGREDDELIQGVVRSALAVGEKYHYDAAHAAQVAELSVKFFDALAAEHGLTARERLLLRVAATLHEVGSFVSGRMHHKHSYYLIANAEIFGLTSEQQRVVALVARYHRRSGPKPTHLEYASMRREARAVVNKLAAILRVADALDRGHRQHVRDLRAERRKDELVVHVQGATDLTLERRAMETKADLFEEVYGMTIRLEEAPPEATPPAD